MAQTDAGMLAGAVRAVWVGLAFSTVPLSSTARIGCSVSTISRELDRNKGKKGYRHKKVQGMARHRIAL